MSSQRRSRTSLGSAVVVGLTTALLAISTHAGQISSDLVEQALDQRIEQLEVPPAPILDALRHVEEKTGLRFAVEDAALDRLPYGPRTQVNIVIRQMSAREALARVFGSLGLRMHVAGDRVAVGAIPAVDRLGRRLTLAEAGVLEKLARAPWASLGPDAVAIELAIHPDERPRETLERALAQTAGPSALEQLEGATRTLGWSWRPQGDRVVVCTRADDVRRRLDEPIDVTWQRRPLDEALIDLGRRVDVTMKFEPGLLRRIAACERAVDFVQRDVTARQVLERLCGTTGMRYEVEPDGVSLRVADDAGAVAAPLAGIQPWVRIEIEVRPGLRVDAFIPVEQLPLELREQCARRLAEFLAESR